MYICVYVYMCICVYVHMCICVYVYMCICVYVYMYICVYVHMCICVYVYMCTCVHVYMCSCVHVYMYRCIRVNIYSFYLHSSVSVSSIVTRGHFHKLYKPKPFINILKFSFQCRIVNLWNKLPNHVCTAVSLSMFKHLLFDNFCV